MIELTQVFCYTIGSMFSPDNLQNRFSSKEVVKYGVYGALAGSLMLLNSCGGTPSPIEHFSTPTPASTPFPTRLPEKPAQPIPNLLEPKTVLGGAERLSYKNGVIVNLTRGINIAVVMDNLAVLNTNPDFRINLKPEDQNITLLFPQPFTANGKKQALDQAESELPLILSGLNTNSGIDTGKARFSIISVGDAIQNIARKNPRQTNPSLFQAALGIELSHAYLGLTRAAIVDAQDTPTTYPEISEDERKKLFEKKLYPFRIDYLNPSYLITLGISRSSI